jgi:hypothetical protein
MDDLTKLAVELARSTRDSLEDDIVELDSAVAVTGQEIKDYEVKRELARKDHDFLWQKRRAVVETSNRLETLVRDLKRPREGWPWLTDEEYEMHLKDAREEVQELIEISGRP